MCFGLPPPAAQLGSVFQSLSSSLPPLTPPHVLVLSLRRFAVIRAYESIGRPDSTSPHTIYNAWDGGMEHVDVSCGQLGMMPDSANLNLS